ncbi:MAG TPA: glycosyltransferase family 4 protein [Flavobacterium sp.]
MDKKILIITYYWPPAGGPGVQRWLKFVKYLPEFGIQPIVYIPENPTYPILDEKLLSEVPADAIIVKRRILEPYGFASIFGKKKIKSISSGIIPAERKQGLAEKLSLWIRGNIFVPDARVLWVIPSVSYLQKYISENRIDTIITSGPPHSLHLIGLRLKEKMNIRWIADFRDPWTSIGYQKNLKLTEFSHNRHKFLERKVLTTADEIIVTSKTTKSDFEAITNKPIEVITNGYDLEKDNAVVLDKKFTVAHIGSFLSERNPILLWQALSELLRDHPSFKEHFELKLIGTVSNHVIDSIRDYNLSDYTNNLGYVSHSDAVAHQRQSQVLLLIEINSAETKSIIPGKLFEYLISGRPIIGIGPNGSDFAEIIADTNAGIFVDYSEKEKLKATISDFYKDFLKGTLKSEAVEVEQFSRKNLTHKLAKLLLK